MQTVSNNPRTSGSICRNSVTASPTTSILLPLRNILNSNFKSLILISGQVSSNSSSLSSMWPVMRMFSSLEYFLSPALFSKRSSSLVYQSRLQHRRVCSFGLSAAMTIDSSRLPAVANNNRPCRGATVATPRRYNNNNINEQINVTQSKTSRARNRVKTCNKCEQYRSKLVCSVTTRKQLSVQARSETLKLGDEVTFGGRLFHNCAATSLRPEKHDRRRNRGMMSSAVDAERSESVQARRHVALL